MKKFFLGVLTLTGIATAVAQNPRAAVTNAMMSLEMYDTDQSNVAELAKAKEDIDFAAGHDQTSSDPKVWRYKGTIYNKIALDSKLKIDNNNAGLIALESFDKAWDLELAKLAEKGKDESKIAAKQDFKEGYEMVCKALYNTGVGAFNEQNYELAYLSFSGILTIKPRTTKGLDKKPVDLTAAKIDMELESTRLAGLAAIQLGKPKEAEELLSPLIDANKITEEMVISIYVSLSNSYQKIGEMDKAKKILAKAREKFPTNQGLLIGEINIALAEGKLKELEGKLKQAVEGDKDNVELHFTLGNVYDGIFREKLEQGNSALAKDFFDKAVEWYQKGADIDSKHFNSEYSLGAIYVNYSNSFAKEMNDITDFKNPKVKELEAKYMSLLDLGLVHLLNAEEINSNDLGVVIALKEVYGRKNDEKNFEKYKVKMDELQKSN